MKKIIAIAALMFAATSAFAIDWSFTIKDNNADTTRTATVNGGAYDVTFPALGANESITYINVVDYNGIMTGTTAWLDEGQTLPAGEQTAFNFRFSGLAEEVLQELEDGMSLTIGYDDNGGFMANDDAVTVESLTRNGDLFTAYFTPTLDVAGIHFLNFNVTAANGGTGLSPTDVENITIPAAYAGEPQPVEPEGETEVPEPATYAYGVMGLVSLIGMKKRFGK